MPLVRKCSRLQPVHLGLPSSSLLRERTLARHQRCVELILSVLAFLEDLLVKCKDNQGTPWAVRGGRLCVASIIELGCACSFTLGVVSSGTEGSRSLLASERFQLTILMLRASNLPRLLNLSMLLAQSGVCSTTCYHAPREHDTQVAVELPSRWE